MTGTPPRRVPSDGVLACQCSSPWTELTAATRMEWLTEAQRIRGMRAPSPPAWVAGIDEVGLGPLAGPVVVAAVVLPRGLLLPHLDDSKKLSAQERKALYPLIVSSAISLSVAFAEAREIDESGLMPSVGSAMRRALDRIAPIPDLVLVDGKNRIVGAGFPQRTVIRGDSRYDCIAAASVVAKVVRDTRMRIIDRRFPGYSMDTNKGYGTRQHLAAIHALGPTPQHRLSFLGNYDDQLGLFDR